MADWFVRVVLGIPATDDQATILAERVGVTYVDRNQGITEVSVYLDAASARHAVNSGLDLVGSGTQIVGLDGPVIEVEAKPEGRHLSQLVAQGVPDMVGMAEVQEILEINTRQQASQLAERRDFPRPVAELKAGRVWLRSDIERFRRQWRRQR